MGEEVRGEKSSKKDLRKESFVIIKALVDSQQDPKYKKALATIRPSLYGISRSGGVNSFIELVKAKKNIKEDQVFAELKMGRKECAITIRKQLKNSEPENRVWISFNPDNGMYSLVGLGKDTPKGWVGFVPINEKMELK